MTALRNLRVLEVGGIGPVPFAGMLLADMGAEVIRVDRPGSVPWHEDEVLLRGRRSILIDLKMDEGREVLSDLIERSDILLEGFRPGVLEALGLGPEYCWKRNARLIIGRMTGWGQSGPLSKQAGHDINYVGLSGALHAIGATDGPPAIPLNLVGDYGGGGLLLAYGVLCGIWSARESGQGQIVDAAMIDGAALLMTKWYGELAAGRWVDTRGQNRVDGGSHYYHIYETADEKYLAVGAVEPQFYEQFLAVLGIEGSPPQHDPEIWPQLTEQISEIIRSRTRSEWEEAFKDVDACVTPVLSMHEAPFHPHVRERQTFYTSGDATLPGPAPRLSRTAAHPGVIPSPGGDTDSILEEVGQSAARIVELRDRDVVA